MKRVRSRSIEELAGALGLTIAYSHTPEATRLLTKTLNDAKAQAGDAVPLKGTTLGTVHIPLAVKVDD